MNDESAIVFSSNEDEGKKLRNYLPECLGPVLRKRGGAGAPGKKLFSFSDFKGFYSKFQSVEYLPGLILKAKWAMGTLRIAYKTFCFNKFEYMFSKTGS